MQRKVRNFQEQMKNNIFEKLTFRYKFKIFIQYQ
jgi:hypothetical protein